MAEAERQSRRTSYRLRQTPVVVDAHNDLLIEVVCFVAEPALQATIFLPPGRSFAESIPGLAGGAAYPALGEARARRGYDEVTLRDPGRKPDPARIARIDLMRSRPTRPEGAAL